MAQEKETTTLWNSSLVA